MENDISGKNFNPTEEKIRLEKLCQGLLISKGGGLRQRGLTYYFGWKFPPE